MLSPLEGAMIAQKRKLWGLKIWAIWKPSPLFSSPPQHTKLASTYCLTTSHPSVSRRNHRTNGWPAECQQPVTLPGHPQGLCQRARGPVALLEGGQEVQLATLCWVVDVWHGKFGFGVGVGLLEIRSMRCPIARENPRKGFGEGSPCPGGRAGFARL